MVGGECNAIPAKRLRGRLMKYRSKLDCQLCNKKNILLLPHLKNKHKLSGIVHYMKVLHERKKGKEANEVTLEVTSRS